MTNPEAAQHPALSLPGFTTSVTLSTGVTVHVRKIDKNAITMAAARDLAAQAGAIEGIQELANLGENETPQFTPDQLGMMLDIRRRTLRAALVQPTLPDLMALYGGREDDADLGLGPDLTTLEEAITAWNAPQIALTAND